MEDINTNLNSSLELKIGVHTGGPIIGGILWNMEFDIIGTDINITHFLEHTCVSGHIQISEKTKELIGDKFIVKRRGNLQINENIKIVSYFVC